MLYIINCRDFCIEFNQCECNELNEYNEIMNFIKAMVRLVHNCSAMKKNSSFLLKLGKLPSHPIHENKHD